jgi:hypothetical protein
MDAGDFLAGSPIDTRSMALDAARELDEATREPEEPEGGQPSAGATLSEIMSEVAGPALTAETIRDIFQVASSSLSRGLIFAVRAQGAQGLAHYGLEETVAPASERVRGLWLPHNEYSLISTVILDKEAFRGIPDQVRANTNLVMALGGDWPTDSVALPMMIGDRVGLVFYGDNQPEGMPVGSTEVLEATLAAIGERLAEAGQ